MEKFKTVHQTKNDLEQFYTKPLTPSETLELITRTQIKTLIKANPNDTELGAIVRKLFS